MPKERINTGAEVDILVGWSKDHDVQIGLGVADGRAIVDVLYRAQSDQIGASVRRIVDDSKGRVDEAVGNLVLDYLTALNHGYDTFWASHVERPGVNRLIRTLRQARDSAYGRDE